MQSKEMQRKSIVQGISIFLDVLRVRNDSGPCAQDDGHSTYFAPGDSGGQLTCKPLLPVLLWHMDCYSIFTSSNNLAVLSVVMGPQAQNHALTKRATT